MAGGRGGGGVGWGVGLCSDRDQGTPPALAKLGGTKRRRVVGEMGGSDLPTTVTPSHCT